MTRDRATTGQAIRALRVQIGMTIGQAAWLAHWPDRRWSRLEHGGRADPRWSTIKKVCQALGCTPDTLLDAENAAD